VLAVAAASFDHLLSRMVLAVAAALVIAAAIRALTGWKHVMLDAPFYFLFGQTALLYGLIKGCLGKQSVMGRRRIDRTSRSDPPILPLQRDFKRPETRRFHRWEQVREAARVRVNAAVSLISAGRWLSGKWVFDPHT
jgi:hypothetical protein